MMQNGHVGSMPPAYGRPPIAHPIANMKQWNRLDPSEILVHNVKCLDQVDDLLEEEMRKQFKAKFMRKA
jgi:hypothetical protein